MTRTDLAIRASGGFLGMLAAAGVMTWAWLRSCERASERGFGE